MGWTIDWQRRHTGLKALLADGALLTDIVPGVIRRGDDIGRWLTRQQRDFGRLNTEQQKRLAAALDVLLAVPARKAPTAAGAKAGTARGTATFTRGLAALAQYVQQEQRTVIPRQHTERITVDGQDHDIRLGVWVSNQKTRRDKLNEQQLAKVAKLGMAWAPQ